MANLTIKDAFKALENVDIEIVETPKKKIVKLSESIKNKKLKESQKSLKEAEESEKSKVVDFIKDAVEGLKNKEATNYKYDLDGLLGLFVGWSAGYGEEKRNDCIQSEENSDYAINVGIKVKNQNDWADFDMLNFPYHENGEVEDLSISIEPEEDYDKLAEYVLKMYEDIKDKDIDNDGLIHEKEVEVEESCKSKKDLKEGREYSEEAFEVLSDGTKVYAIGTTRSTRNYNYEDVKFVLGSKVGYGTERWLNRPWHRFTFANGLWDAMTSVGISNEFAKECIDNSGSLEQAIEYFAQHYSIEKGVEESCEVKEDKVLSNKKIDSIVKRNQKYLDHIKIKPDSKNVVIDKKDTSKVGEPGNPIQQGLRGRANKLEAKEEPTDMKKLKDVKLGQTFIPLENLFYCDIKVEGLFEDEPELVDEYVDLGLILKGTKLYFPKNEKIKYLLSHSVDVYLFNGETFEVGEWNDDSLNTSVKIVSDKTFKEAKEEPTDMKSRLDKFVNKDMEVEESCKLKEEPQLEPIHDGRKSFYGKADWHEEQDGTKVLYSYDTKVCEITPDGKVKLLSGSTPLSRGYKVALWRYSPTTLRHVKEFLRQNGFKADSVKQMEKDYLGESLTEGTLVNINDTEEVKKGIEELEKPVEVETTEKIVDVDADTVEKIKDSYIGNVILQCPVCRTLVYKEPDKLVKDGETELYNLEDECPHCGSVDGYELVGQVAKADVEISSEDDEEEKSKELPVEEPVEEVEDEEEFTFESLETDKFDNLINRYMHEVYSNIGSYETTSANIDDENNQIIVEGKIKFNSGKEKVTKFIFEAHLKTVKGKYKFKGLNETFSKTKGFTLTTTLNEKMLVPESFWYNYNIKQLNESKQIKGSVRL